MVRSQLRDFPSASVAHGASYCMDVLRVTRSSAPFDWLFDAFGPIVWLRRRGFYRSGGGDRLQTYKRCLESRGEEGKIRKKNIWRRRRGGCRQWVCVCVSGGGSSTTTLPQALLCVNMPTSFEKLRRLEKPRRIGATRARGTAAP